MVGEYNVGRYETIAPNGQRPVYDNITGKLLWDPVTGKQYRWNGTRFVRRELYDGLVQEGEWISDAGYRLLSSPTQYGTTGNIVLASSNISSTRFLTTTTVNSVAGQRIARLITRRNAEPCFVYTVQAGDPTNTQHYHGFASYTTQIPASVTNPFGVNDSGVMLGFRAGGNFKVYYHDGDGSTPPTPIDTGLAVVPSQLFQFGLELQTTKVIWNIFNTENKTQTASGEITTDIPAGTTSLAPHWHVELINAVPAVNLYLATAKIVQKG